eukprot:7031212-Lingulodinium_polyedra.AAC.1
MRAASRGELLARGATDDQQKPMRRRALEDTSKWGGTVSQDVPYIVGNGSVRNAAPSLFPLLPEMLDRICQPA